MEIVFIAFLYGIRRGCRPKPCQGISSLDPSSLRVGLPSFSSHRCRDAAGERDTTLLPARRRPRAAAQMQGQRAAAPIPPAGGRPRGCMKGPQPLHIQSCPAACTPDAVVSLHFSVVPKGRGGKMQRGGHGGGTVPPPYSAPRCYSSILSTAMNASLGTCTLPSWRMRFLPSFCFSSSFRLRVMSPP